jgi:ABC-2 type transport system permease protein
MRRHSQGLPQAAPAHQAVMPAGSPVTAFTSITDRGYRRYDGTREGRRRRLQALFASSLRRALGLRRSWRAKLVPWGLILLAFVPAELFLLMVIAGLTSDGDELTYAEQLDAVAVVILPLAATVAAELVCPERRDNVLTLIFTRPVTASEYIGAKLAALLAVLTLVTLGPAAILFVATVLAAPSPAAYLADHLIEIPRILAACAVLALSFASVSLAVSAFFSRRGVALVATVGVYFVAAVATGTLAALDVPGSRFAPLLDPGAAPYRVVDLVYGRAVRGGFTGVAAGAAAALLIAGAVATLLVRIRRAAA